MLMALGISDLKAVALDKLRFYLPRDLLSRRDFDINSFVDFERAIDGEGIYAAGIGARLAVTYDSFRDEAVMRVKTGTSAFKEDLFGFSHGKYGYKIRVIEGLVNARGIGCIVAEWISVSRR